MARPTGRNVRAEVLASATELVRRGGVSGFSYGDLATELGVRAPSIHHHVGTKAELVHTITVEYRRRFGELAAAIPTDDTPAWLRAYGGLYLDAAIHDLGCLCGAALANWVELSAETRDEVDGFLDDQHQLVAAAIRRGVDAGALRHDIEPARLAAVVVAALEGVLLVARGRRGPDAVREVIDGVIALARVERSPGAD